MKGPLSFAAGLALLLPAGQLGAQTLHQRQAAAPTAIRPAPPPLLRTLFLQKAWLQDLTVPADLPASVAIRARVARDVRSLVLHAQDIRAPGFQLIVSDQKGLHAVPAPPSTTYRGHVAGLPGSTVAASLIRGQLTATVRIGNDTWAIQPASEIDPAYGRATHVSFKTSDSLPIPNISCGVTQVTAPAGRTGGGSVGPAALKLAEVGIDADFDFYVKKGSSITNVQNAVNQVMNAVDVIYKRDVQITYKITAIIVRTSRVYSGTLSSRLGQFRSRWNSFHGNVKRDMAHLFSGQGSFSGIIGVAFLGVVCNLFNAYGTSKAFHSRNDVNAGLVAHEMGHNWNAPHCNNCGSDCRIMCSGLGGCGRDFSRFGNCSKSAILRFKNTRNCLSDPGPPQLTAISPNRVQAFLGGKVTLTGTNLSGVTAVNVGAVSANFSVKSSTQIEFTSPDARALGAVQVTVKNSNGTSNGVTLTYLETKPPKMTVTSLQFVNFPINWRYGGKPGAIALMLWNGDGRSVPIFGTNILLPIVILPTGTLDAAGIGSLTFTPGPALRGIRLWSQVATFSGTSFAGATNFGNTLIF